MPAFILQIIYPFVVIMGITTQTKKRMRNFPPNLISSNFANTFLSMPSSFFTHCNRFPPKTTVFFSPDANAYIFLFHWKFVKISYKMKEAVPKALAPQKPYRRFYEWKGCFFSGMCFGELRLQRQPRNAAILAPFGAKMIALITFSFPKFLTKPPHSEISAEITLL
jgi:hypothetical protein